MRRFYFRFDYINAHRTHSNCTDARAAVYADAAANPIRRWSARLPSAAHDDRWVFCVCAMLRLFLPPLGVINIISLRLAAPDECCRNCGKRNPILGWPINGCKLPPISSHQCVCVCCECFVRVINYWQKRERGASRNVEKGAREIALISMREHAVTQIDRCWSRLPYRLSILFISLSHNHKHSRTRNRECNSGEFFQRWYFGIMNGSMPIQTHLINLWGKLGDRIWTCVQCSCL